jgi:hypothetical protein
MPATEKSILKKLRAEVQKNRAGVDIFDELVAESFDCNFDPALRDQLVAAAIAITALKVDPSNSDHNLLKKAFASCSLDPEKPHHWRLLLDSLVSVCFRESGAPEKWDDLGFFRLLTDIRALQKAEPALESNPDVAKRLQTSKLFGTKYENRSKAALTKLVAKARSPALDYLNEADLGMVLLKRQHEAAGKKWTDEYERNIRPVAEKILNKLLERELQEMAMTILKKKHAALGVNWTEEKENKYHAIVQKLVRDEFLYLVSLMR